MKLLEKNNRIFFRFTALLLLGGSILFYLALNRVIRSEVDEKIMVDQLRVIQQIETSRALPNLFPVIESHLLEDGASSDTAQYLTDTLLFDPVEQEQEPFRQLSVTKKINGSHYRVIVRTSLVESEELLFTIGIITAVLGLILIAGLYWLNRWWARQLWQPFHQQLSALRGFSLAQPASLNLANSNTEEFEELRIVIEQLTGKLLADYQNLKEFTENASHEIQTPLTIMRSKIEALAEDGHLTEKQTNLLQEIYQATNRLSRLNKSLLLLSKIENRQFSKIENITFNDLIREQTEWLSELTAARQITIDLQPDDELSVSINRTLAEILVKNLLENAIRHTRPQQTIRISISSRKLIFANPGIQPIHSPEQLFDRFHKRDMGSEHIGLGLAIVQKICEVNNCKTGYEFKNGHHEFFVSFPV